MPDALHRFTEAQGGIYQQALGELRAGAKHGHWMWFIFPQLKGLGRSNTAQYYALDDLAEAQAYLAHPLLGPRLQACSGALIGWAGRRSAKQIFGTVDALKLVSSMTLFETAARLGSQDASPFTAVLDAFNAGLRDAVTLELLATNGHRCSI